MRITKTGTYLMTGIAVAMFILLSMIFDTLTRFELDGPWFSQANERGETSFIDGVFWTYVFIALIVVAGLVVGAAARNRFCRLRTDRLR